MVPFVAQIFLAVGLTGWFSLRHGEKAVNDLAKQLRTQVTTEIAHHLEDQLTLPQKINQLNLTAIQLGLLNPQDFNRMGDLFWQQMHLFDVGYINYANQQGEFIGVERLETGELLINEVSRRRTNGDLYVYQTRQHSTDTSLTTPQVPAPNQAIPSARTRLQTIKTGYDPRLEAWYADVAREKKPLWSDIYQWEDKPEVMSISSSYPIYDHHHQLIGVIGVDLILSAISQFLNSLTINSSGRSFILERNGLLVASSGRELPFVISHGKAGRMLAHRSRDPLIQATSEYLQQRFGNLHQVQVGQSLQFTAMGERQYVQITPWCDSMGLDWLIVVVVPESNFMEQIYVNVRTTILLCALALALAVLVGLVTSRWIADRIAQLIEASQAIADGQLDQTVHVKGVYELEILSHAFQRMANRLKESFSQLEERVQQRTAELAAAKDAAIREAVRSDDANRAKSEFLATMSHELRTPLNAILGFAQVIKHDTELNPTHHNHLDIICRSGEHLLNLINDVLEASRLEVGNVALQETSFDLYHLLNVLQQMFQFRAKGKGITLRVDYDTDVPQYLYADASKLRQILINLVDNAIKFTMVGQVVVTVRTLNGLAAASQSCLQFAVTDTGLGIKPDDIQILFEPFVQTETGQQSHQGTGLGLYISHRFVHLMGGTLTCTSQLGEGTQFHFDLPVTVIDPVKYLNSVAPSVEVGVTCLNGYVAGSIMGEEGRCQETVHAGRSRVSTLQQPAYPASSLVLDCSVTTSLLQMPPEWIAQLHQAAIKGFDDVIFELIEQIPPSHSALADQLTSWIRDFQFDNVIELIHQTFE